jgi:LmbE family N-acetylglucosaminyl deacetylase
MPPTPQKSALALFAHPDDIEFVAAGTLLQLRLRGWELHYMNLCTGNGGSVQMDATTTAAVRLAEAQNAARTLGAHFYPPICDDLELVYDIGLMRKVAAVVRETRPSIVFTHSPQDYMEDHMTASRLAVTAAFAHGVPNFQTHPPRDAFFQDVTIYHALPHGLCDPLRQRIRAGLYVDTTPVHAQKREALACHASQKDWLDVSQGMDSYLVSMDEMSRAVGVLSGKFEHAEGWRRHLHLGFSSHDIDPLRIALDGACTVDEVYEASLTKPR